jgi:Holliday junction resolvase RusA-like endonuclease
MGDSIKAWRLHITPHTNIRTTKNERWMFSEKVSDEYLLSFGKRKFDERVARGSKNPGSPNNYYNRKYYILKYFDYKRALKLEAERNNFVLPEQESWVKFYIPMPPSWSKKKRNQMSFTLKKSKPDTKNYITAMEDALLKEDAKIADYRLSKFWYDGSTGFIEITIGELPPANGYSKYVREDKIK